MAWSSLSRYCKFHGALRVKDKTCTNGCKPNFYIVDILFLFQSTCNVSEYQHMWTASRNFDDFFQRWLYEVSPCNGEKITINMTRGNAGLPGCIALWILLMRGNNEAPRYTNGYHISGFTSSFSTCWNTKPNLMLMCSQICYRHKNIAHSENPPITVDLGYKRLSLMRDDFSGPSVQNVRNFRQL